MKLPLYNLAGEAVGEVELNDSVFGAELNTGLLHDAVVRYQANQRVGTSKVKTRAEVRGGGRKPWRQKGTGRARQGSIRAPHWRKGGIAFGPSPRDFSLSMPKKARRKALCVALSAKVREGNLIVIEDLNMQAPKTKEVRKVLEAVAAPSSLLVTPVRNKAVYLSGRNLPGVAVDTASDINVYEVLRYPKVVLMQSAIEKIEGVLG